MNCREFTFQVSGQRRLNLEILQEKVDKIKNRLVTEGRAKKGWRVDQTDIVSGKIQSNDETTYTYTFSLSVFHSPVRRVRADVLVKEWQHITQMLARHLRNSRTELISVKEFEVEVVEIKKDTCRNCDDVVCEFYSVIRKLDKEEKRRAAEENTQEVTQDCSTSLDVAVESAT